jgi:serine/threonine protein kinase
MNSSPSPKSCPRCGLTLPEQAPGGLCPACLLKHSLEDPAPNAQPPEAELQELAAAFPQLEVEELIGQGGMGRVFRARQPHLNRTVALKLLSAERADDPEWQERFTREARALARLSHPNIVQVYDFGDKPVPFLLMEHVDGVNLRQAMDTGGLTTGEALALIPKLCDALQYAHEHGVLHRDIKPENILIDTEGRVKLVDFGLAKLRDEGALPFTLTQSNARLGTLAYMAPEQVEKPADVDHRADIYSLGVVFYEMLTGELPLGRFPTPSEASGIDPRLDGIVMRTLEKKQSKRPDSAKELRTEIERAQTGAAPQTPSGRTHAAILLVTGFAALLASLSSMKGFALFSGLGLATLSGLAAALCLRRHYAGEPPKTTPWPYLIISLSTLVFFATEASFLGSMFAILAMVGLLTSIGFGKALQRVGWVIGALFSYFFVTSVTAMLHEWLADGMKAPTSILIALSAGGLFLGLSLAFPQLRAAWNGLPLSGSTGLRIRRSERIAAAVLAVGLSSSFPRWMPQIRFAQKPLHQHLMATQDKSTDTASQAVERRRKKTEDKPIYDRSNAWVSRISQAATKEAQQQVFAEIELALSADKPDDILAALHAISRSGQFDFDRTTFRSHVRHFLDSDDPEVRAGALLALIFCEPDTSDNKRLLALVPDCTEFEIPSLAFALKHVSNADFNTTYAAPILDLLRRGMAAAQRDRGNIKGFDSRFVLAVIQGSQVSPDIEAQLIEWTHLDKDENGLIKVGNSQLGYNTLYHALSVQQNKSRAAVERLIELAYHPDSNVFGRCIMGLNRGVSDPADQVYVAEEMVKLLGLRHQEGVLWSQGLALLKNYATPEHLPALEALASRETLTQEHRDALNSILQNLRARKP